MLQKILEAIEKKAEAEIEKILKQKEETLLDLEEQCQKEISERKTEFKELFQKKARQEIEEFKQAECLKAAFKQREEKNGFISKVYEGALQKVENLTEPDFNKVIKGLLCFLPKAVEGEIIAGQRTANVLRRTLAEKIPVKEGLSEEGFLLRTSEMEMDLRISQILEVLKERIGPNLIKILFI